MQWLSGFDVFSRNTPHLRQLMPEYAFESLTKKLNDDEVSRACQHPALLLYEVQEALDKAKIALDSTRVVRGTPSGWVPVIVGGESWPHADVPMALCDFEITFSQEVSHCEVFLENAWRPAALVKFTYPYNAQWVWSSVVVPAWALPNSSSQPAFFATQATATRNRLDGAQVPCKGGATSSDREPSCFQMTNASWVGFCDSSEGYPWRPVSGIQKTFLVRASLWRYPQMPMPHPVRHLRSDVWHLGSLLKNLTRQQFFEASGIDDPDVAPAS